MSFLKISHLTSADTNSLANTDSFLTEIDPTDLTKIVGGGGHCYGDRKKKSYHPCPPVEECPPVDCHPVEECPPPVECHPIVYCPPVMKCPPVDCHPC
jgi:hypothetical protein